MIEKEHGESENQETEICYEVIQNYFKNNKHKNIEKGFLKDYV